MPFIEHSDREFIDLYELFYQINDQLDHEQTPAARLGGHVTAALGEFINYGLHRPDPSIPVNLEAPAVPRPDPVHFLTHAVSTRLTVSDDLEETLRLSRAREHLLEAVDAL